MKRQTIPDLKASEITFGVELETTVPTAADLSVGSYHGGRPVTSALDPNRAVIAAPTFNGKWWRAERDSSIQPERGHAACEFVSPILKGEAGVETLCGFVGWANAIGARVNASCGCHVTVSADSVIGTSDPDARGEFARKLAHIARWHARAIYGQTGTGRHLNLYAAPLAPQVATLARQMAEAREPQHKVTAATLCGRGMINFRKLFSAGLVEFRAFAGTLNLLKVQHHVATALGLCRRAHEVQCLGAFDKNKAQQARTRTAADAVRFLWDYLGWTGSKRPAALGQFGRLHSDFPTYSREALRLCEQFDERFPDAPL
jgi:hypothetical protein